MFGKVSVSSNDAHQTEKQEPYVPGKYKRGEHRIKENRNAGINQKILEPTEKNGLMRMRFQRDVDQTYYLVRTDTTDTITKEEPNAKKKNDYVSCEQCGQGYDSKELLTSHILQQHDSNPF